MPPTLGLLQQQIDQHRTDAEEGHGRLRSDFRSLEKRVIALEANRVGDSAQLQVLSSRVNQPVEVSSLRFTPTMVIGTIAICASIIGSATWLRSDVQNLSDQLTTQTKLQDERMQALKTSVDAVQRMEQLHSYDIQGLKETILKQTPRR